MSPIQIGFLVCLSYAGGLFTGTFINSDKAHIFHKWNKWEVWGITHQQRSCLICGELQIKNQ